MRYDFVVIGGGIVGCATALELLKNYPGSSLLLIEKELAVGKHQTSHNSGVIHAGIYYTPGSVKAKLCREGLETTKDFCRTYDIPFNECGKLIVATNQIELERITDLYDRAQRNGLRLEKLNGRELSELEPSICGVGALLSPETGIVDYGQICKKIAQLIENLGGTIQLGAQIKSIIENSEEVIIGLDNENIETKKLIVCGGLQADRLALMAGLQIDFRIVPFRGEYYQLPNSKNDIVRHLIYPAPDPALPFLGIHLTRMIDGSVTVGPNAVIGFSREGYAPLSLSIPDTVGYLAYPGFWRLVYKYREHVVSELQSSLSKNIYLNQCRKYCPSLEYEDLLPYRAGIRAQLITKDGALVHDFVFKQTERMLHVCNAPSPAATSAIPIARMILKNLA